MSDDDKTEDEQPATPETSAQRARRIIHERRNRFVAAALAGAGMTASCETTPGVCLSMYQDVPADDVGPRVCLEPPGPDPDYPPPGPQVCLQPPLPPEDPFPLPPIDDAGTEDSGKSGKG